jgi:hypothetical protein
MEARIAGTKDELLALAEKLKEAATTGNSEMQSFCSDGEGYDLYVYCIKDGDVLPVPYTDEIYQDDAEVYKNAPWNKEQA